ncbi:signal peptidase I [Malassezia vespertilionis]|uniref:signal peptidase I n=1 Tax=Malassezia vespertilionis TaxID=2020962 RepID=UPI0024B22D17|nr:signal peptidase I [Malassezia vespertilionis]WFD07672.1 signal peptidase I [Malassezia vespertilionis]
MLTQLFGPTWRRQLWQLVYMLNMVAFALVCWKGYSLVVDTETPVVVVLSGSMEPGYYRGDILFLASYPRPYKVGDVTVYSVENGKIPIVHRVIETHSDQVVGRVVGYIPYVGYVTLVMNDFPIVKYIVLGLVGISMLYERE